MPLATSESGEAWPDSRRLTDLTALLEVSRQLGATTELEPLLATIGESCLQVLDCERSTIFLYDRATDELFSRIGTGLLGGGGERREIRFPADRGIAGEAFRAGAVVNVPDAYADPRFNPQVDRQTGFRTRNLLTCPLRGIDGSPVGVLQVLNRRGGPFGRWEEELITAFAAQAGVAIQRQLLLESFAESQRLQADLATARSIQQQLLPRAAPRIPGFDIAGWNRPADQTGGDFFDYLELPGGRLALTLADVSGHGIGPALLAAETRALIRACLAVSPDLTVDVPQVNDLLAADVDGRFATAFVGILDAASASCEFLSAGQGPIVFYQAATRRVLELPTHGPPLGVLAGMTFDPATRIVFQPGDCLVLCTDGFVEWPNADGVCYGNDRMFRLIERSADLSAEELIDTLQREVATFAGGLPQQDDLTALIVKRSSANPGG